MKNIIYQCTIIALKSKHRIRDTKKLFKYDLTKASANSLGRESKYVVNAYTCP